MLIRLRPQRVPSGLSLRLLRFGWGNEVMAACCHYLGAISRIVIEEVPTQRVLECGSGVSTLVLGALGDINGFSVLALERESSWRVRVAGLLAKHRITSVSLPPVQLASYDGYDWYDVSTDQMPRFEVVVCDGPSGRTRGGRYGLLPVMRSLLDDAVILLDANREGERAVLARWESEFAAAVELQPRYSRGLAIVTCPTPGRIVAVSSDPREPSE